MKEPTDKQIQEFWGLCGFTLKELHPLESKEPYFVLHKPNGVQWDYWIGKSWDTKIPIRTLYPPIDLNNLFKYAVPKVLKGCSIELNVMETGTRVNIYDDFGDGKMIVTKEQDPALALFWAIYKALGGKK